jgi:hypothetical protein
MILRFLELQNSRVNNREISGATVRNYVKAIKLFCEMADLPIPWKKLTRGLPRAKNYADDRIPSIEEIRRLLEYPDRRIKANHSLRKWFKTRCEIGGMKPINVETLLSHSVGVSNSYYRPTETELLEEYLNVQDFLILGNEHKVQRQVLELEEKKKDDDYTIKAKLQEKDKQLAAIQILHY